MKTTDKRASVYDQITERIISMLEKGTVPWRKPWKSQSGKSNGGTVYGGEQGDAKNWNESLADSSGTSSTWTESENESESESSMLIPIMGKELSHVQFRSLEEQLFRSMAVLFDQEQRHGVARLVGMSAPVSLKTPEVVKMPASPERTKRYLDRCYEKLPFAVSGEKAQEQIAERAENFADTLLDEAEDAPRKMKRRIK